VLNGSAKVEAFFTNAKPRQIIFCRPFSLFSCYQHFAQKGVSINTEDSSNNAMLFLKAVVNNGLFLLRNYE
jgi:hypothetical protein